MTAKDRFTTSVLDSSGIWPPSPEWMSYSSLREIEGCPRRWALRRATYAGIWDRPGYPDLPSLHSLVGEVVHLSLQTAFRALTRQGCDSARTPAAVRVLRDLGGYSAIVESAIQAKLDSLASNPRVDKRLLQYRHELMMKVPELRRRVQEVVTRSNLSPRLRIASPESVRPHALSYGSYTEIEVRAHAMRWLGRVDLINLSSDACEIIDFKTGSEQQTHVTQLQTYALLWYRDELLNPTGRLPTRLALVYPTRDIDVALPGIPELAQFEADLRLRGEDSRRAIERRPPEARPSAETCSMCSVRQLCDEYWQYIGNGQVGSAGEEPTLGDVEVVVRARRGPKSWDVSITSSGGPGDITARLRTHEESDDLIVGRTLRLLAVLIQRDPESHLVLLTMTSFSEMFRIIGRLAEQ